MKVNNSERLKLIRERLGGWLRVGKIESGREVREST
jgi:hypothetical protein